MDSFVDILSINSPNVAEFLEQLIQRGDGEEFCIAPSKGTSLEFFPRNKKRRIERFINAFSDCISDPEKDKILDSLNEFSQQYSIGCVIDNEQVGHCFCDEIDNAGSIVYFIYDQDRDPELVKKFQGYLSQVLFFYPPF